MHDIDVAGAENVSRSVYRSQLPDCPSGNRHTVTVWATWTADGLTVQASESTSWPCDDIDYTCHVASEHIGKLRLVLGAVSDDDLIEQITRNYQDGTIPVLSLDTWLTRHGLPNSTFETRHPN